jgi:hypothetical protein
MVASIPYMMLLNVPECIETVAIVQTSPQFCFIGLAFSFLLVLGFLFLMIADWWLLSCQI